MQETIIVTHNKIKIERRSCFTSKNTTSEIKLKIKNTIVNTELKLKQNRDTKKEENPIKAITRRIRFPSFLI